MKPILKSQYLSARPKSGGGGEEGGATDSALPGEARPRQLRAQLLHQVRVGPCLHSAER